SAGASASQTSIGKLLSGAPRRCTGSPALSALTAGQGAPATIARTDSPPFAASSTQDGVGSAAPATRVLTASHKPKNNNGRRMPNPVFPLIRLQPSASVSHYP